jgi:hypothetical protein
MNVAVVAAQIRPGNDPAQQPRNLAIVDISLISSVRFAISSSSIFLSAVEVSGRFEPAENLRDR